MRTRVIHCLLSPVVLLALAAPAARAQSITHQIALPQGMTWCEDAMINGLFTEINAFRAQRGVPVLKMDALGMKDAEMRAVQFSQHMATALPGSPGFNPHEGYDTTAASLGYNLVSENLAYITSDPKRIVLVLWQDPLHLSALLSKKANVAGVSCVYSEGTPYWTYEPGHSAAVQEPPPAETPALNSEQWAFLTLINNYRAQNGAGPLQVSATLQKAAQWMSSDMAAKGYVSHTDSLGRSAGARIAAFGYTYNPWGENIAAGYADAQNAFEQWRTACDPDGSGACTYAHRKNMLNPGFVVIGIGRASGSSAYGWYWTTDFGGYADQIITPGTPPPPQGSVPVISSFNSAPSVITAGQSTTLTWNVSGAATLSIDNGVGSVSGVASKVVSPGQTTTYKLTAANSAGSATAMVTVTVNTMARDTQPPTAPVISSAIARSATRVDLAWTAATDNTGVAGYRIIRNGAVLKSVAAAALSYTDRAAAPGTKYTYTVKAYDAAGNVSAASNRAQLTTPGAQTSAPCPAPASGAFTGCYYNNTDLFGDPALIRTDSQIRFDWGTASPAPAVTPRDFSARWQGYFDFEAAEYTFTSVASDGMKVYIDGQLILDRWRDQPAYMYNVRRVLSAGQHLVVVEYYQRTGMAAAHLSWQKSFR